MPVQIRRALTSRLNVDNSIYLGALYHVSITVLSRARGNLFVVPRMQPPSLEVKRQDLLFDNTDLIDRGSLELRIDPDRRGAGEKDTINSRVFTFDFFLRSNVKTWYGRSSSH